MAATDQLFRTKAPGIMRKLMADFSIDVNRAAAIVGNLGHESAGFKSLQELMPLVPGSRGGFGWAQWTGPRRVQFEAFCKNNGFAPASDEANYGFLKWELVHTETKAIPALRKAASLRAQVVAFEANFERAHPNYKHYDSRERWARIALAAFGAPVPAESPKARDAAVIVGGGAAGGAGAAAAGFDTGGIVFVVLLIVVAMAAVIAYVRMRKP